METQHERRQGIARALWGFLLIGTIVSALTHWDDLARSPVLDNSDEIAFLFDAIWFTFLTMLGFSVLGLILWLLGVVKR